MYSTPSYLPHSLEYMYVVHELCFNLRGRGIFTRGEGRDVPVPVCSCACLFLCFGEEEEGVGVVIFKVPDQTSLRGTFSGLCSLVEWSGFCII